MRVAFAVPARAEVRRAQAFYAAIAPSLGDDFALAVERGVQQVSRNPLMWPPFTEGTRRHLLDRFPYALVFRIEHETVRIVAVTHQSRRPGYWRGR